MVAEMSVPAEPIRFDGRVAIVTGAGNGLGRDYALNLAARGARVVVNDLGVDTSGQPLSGTGESAAQRVVREIGAAGGTAIACHESCATRSGGSAIVESAMEAFGRIDIVIHNAGFMRNAPFELLSDDQIDSLIDVHLKAGFFVGQPAFAQMKRQGYGRMLMTSSASGMFGMPWQAAYGAAKAGLAGLVNVIAIEGAKHGITANGLLPTGSGRLGRSAPGSVPWPDDLDEARHPEMKLIAPGMDNAFVTPMVLWLVSEQCRVSHALYSATAGRFARVFTGATRGWLADYDCPPTPEDIAERIGEIDDMTHFDVPAHVFEEFAPIIARRKARMQAGG